MKTKLLLTLTLLAFLACKKESIPIYYPGDMPFGKMMGKKEGYDWVASSYAQQQDNDPAYFGILASTCTIEGFLRETLGLNKIPMKTGSYKISGPYNNIFDGFVGSSYGTSRDDGDVAEDNYIVDETADDNYIEITYLDTIANLVKGKFTVTYVVTTEHAGNPNNPDKVKFSDGEFEVEFIK